ncbi:MAG: hypothetical protein BJ554DRAFT_1621, partial [Olpidium bornovanus]
RAKLDDGGAAASDGESGLAVVLGEKGSGGPPPSPVPPGPGLPRPEQEEEEEVLAARAAAASAAAAALAAEFAETRRTPGSDAARVSAEDHGKFRSLAQKVLGFETAGGGGGGGGGDDGAAEELAAVLEDLADVVSERVLGLKLAERPGLLAAVADRLDHPHWRVRKTSALVVGSAAQNAALKMNLAYRLLRALEAEDVPQVSREQIYALSALMRGNHAARMFFLDAVRGLEITADVWRRNSERGVVRKKLAVFVTDLLDASMDPDAGPPAAPAEPSPAGPRFHRAAAPAPPGFFQSPDRDGVQAVGPGPSDPALRDRDVADWCALLSRDLVSGGEHLDADAREKLVLGVRMLLRSSAAACPADPPLRDWLLSEHARFAGDGDFEEYAALALEVADALALRAAASPP